MARHVALWSVRTHLLLLLLSTQYESSNGDNIVHDFECRESFGIHPHPSDPCSFIMCVWFVAHLKHCLPPLVFNPDKLVCDWGQGHDDLGQDQGHAPGNTASGHPFHGVLSDEDNDNSTLEYCNWASTMCDVVEPSVVEKSGEDANKVSTFDDDLQAESSNRPITIEAQDMTCTCKRDRNLNDVILNFNCEMANLNHVIKQLTPLLFKSCKNKVFQARHPFCEFRELCSNPPKHITCTENGNVRPHKLVAPQSIQKSEVCKCDKTTPSSHSENKDVNYKKTPNPYKIQNIKKPNNSSQNQETPTASINIADHDKMINEVHNVNYKQVTMPSEQDTVNPGHKNNVHNKAEEPKSDQNISPFSEANGSESSSKNSVEREDNEKKIIGNEGKDYEDSIRDLKEERKEGCSSEQDGLVENFTEIGNDSQDSSCDESESKSIETENSNIESESKNINSESGNIDPESSNDQSDASLSTHSEKIFGKNYLTSHFRRQYLNLSPLKQRIVPDVHQKARKYRKMNSMPMYMNDDTEKVRAPRRSAHHCRYRDERVANRKFNDYWHNMDEQMWNQKALRAKQQERKFNRIEKFVNCKWRN